MGSTRWIPSERVDQLQKVGADAYEQNESDRHNGGGAFALRLRNAVVADGEHCHPHQQDEQFHGNGAPVADGDRRQPDHAGVDQLLPRYDSNDQRDGHHPARTLTVFAPRLFDIHRHPDGENSRNDEEKKGRYEPGAHC